MSAEPMPAVPGSYILVLEALRPATIHVGRLGAMAVAPGWYLYTGSALGAGGLIGRLHHHLRPVDRPHWHIDYLRQAAAVRAIWYVTDATRWEHHWAGLLARMATPAPCIGFGASDCSCATHCFYRQDKPACAAFGALAQAAYVQHPAIQCATSDEIVDNLDGVPARVGRYDRAVDSARLVRRQEECK